MKKSLIIIFSMLLLIGNAVAQTTNMGGPVSWSKTADNIMSAPLHTMPGFDMNLAIEQDAVRDAAKDSPWRFGHKYSTDFSTENSGSWITMSNGDRIWRIVLECPNALTINVLLENVYIPEGGHIYLYDVNKTNMVGAYTLRNNRDDGLLGTELVHGDKIVVEYYEPQNVKGLGHFTIANVIHGYRSKSAHKNQFLKALNSAGDCNIDVNCPLGTGWEDQIRSVAMIVVNGNGYCSGALINNTCNDGTPYFLTANHCLTGGQAGNFVFRWNWESPLGTESCATTTGSVDPGPPYDQTANGSTILVSGTEADHGLLLIDNMTLTDAQNWGLFYAGWSNDDTENAVNLVTGIHHPSGDVKKICQADDGAGNGIIHAVNSGAQTWEIDLWEEGVTEPGSSGSPLFDQNGRIIGQLYGGSAACTGTTSAGFDYYGRLGVSWGLGIGNYLAPVSCGTAVTNDGWDPNTPTFDYTIEALPSSLTVCQPNDAVYTLNIGEVGGFVDPVALSISGLPAGVNANFSANPVTPVGTSDLTISNTGAATPGTYTLTIEANSTSGIKTVDVELIIGDISPSSASLLTPTNGANITLVPTSFTWSSSSEPGANYSIEIATDAAFSSIIDQGTGLTIESFTTSILNMNMTYYWRVMTLTSCGTSTWSTVNSFSTTSCLTSLSQDIPVTISASGTPVVTSTIDILSTGIINDVNVIDLIGTHSRVKNLVITLQSPLGTTVTLMDQPCNNNHSDFDVDYDDGSATGVLPCAPIDGNAYQPIGLLSDFNGENAFGTWTLTLSDMVNNNGGELQTWSLEICTDPVTACLNPELPITSGVTSICSGNTTTLSVTSGNLNDATDWQWYETSCGGTAIGTGTTLVVSPTINTSYFVRGEGGCVVPGACTQVDVVVNPIFNETANASICQGNTYIFGSQSLTVAGTFTEMFNSVSGCDSTVVLTLDVITSFNETANASICQGDTYTFGAQSLAAAGTYTELFTSTGGCDSTVILTLSVNPIFNETASASICQGDTYTFGTQSLAAAGTYTELFTSTGGCDSTVILILSVNPIFNETASASICQGDTYNFGAQSLTSAGTYTELFTSSIGCDSTVVLTLSVNPIFNETASTSICQGATYNFGTQSLTNAGTYTELFTSSNGCDSTVTLTLDVITSFNETATASICQGDTYTFGAQSLTSAGTYTELFTSSGGCDSTVVLTLSSNPTYTETVNATICSGETYTFPDGSISTIAETQTSVLASISGCDSIIVTTLSVQSIDVSVNNGGATLTANQTGAEYIWIDCSNGNSPITGETGITFTPTTPTGNYAVIVTVGSCSDTSDCILVDNSGLEENNINQVLIYPNPTSNEISINWIGEIKSIEITDTKGKVLTRVEQFSGQSLQLNVNSYANGVYFVHVVSDLGRSVHDIVKH